MSAKSPSEEITLLVTHFGKHSILFNKDQRFEDIKKFNAAFDCLQQDERSLTLSIILQSELPTLAINLWDRKGLSPQFVEEISILVHSLTSAIFECQAFSDSQVTNRICSLFHELYASASKVHNPQLAQIGNIAISEKFVSGLFKSEHFASSFLELHPDFSPYKFFISHCASHYIQVSKCVSSSQNYSALSKVIEEQTPQLMSHLAWTSSHSLDTPGCRWKLQMIILSLNDSTNHSSICLLQSFLKSVEPWQTLLELSLYLLSRIPASATADAVVGSAIQTQMSLIINPKGMQYFDEKDIVCICEFVSKLCICNNFELMKENFFVEAVSDQEAKNRVLIRFKRNCFVTMKSSQWFIQSFVAALPSLCGLVCKSNSRKIELSAKKSISGFILNGFKMFLSNSFVVNSHFCSAIVHLAKCNCTASDTFPIAILCVLSDMMESKEFTELSRLYLKEKNCHIDGIHESFRAESFSHVLEDGRERPGQIDYKENLERDMLYLFDTTAGAVYASVVAFEMCGPNC